MIKFKLKKVNLFFKWIKSFKKKVKYDFKKSSRLGNISWFFNIEFDFFNWYWTILNAVDLF